jgi:hypothetical protein
MVRRSQRLQENRVCGKWENRISNAIQKCDEAEDRALASIRVFQLLLEYPCRLASDPLYRRLATAKLDEVENLVLEKGMSETIEKWSRVATVFRYYLDTIHTHPEYTT